MLTLEGSWIWLDTDIYVILKKAEVKQKQKTKTEKKILLWKFLSESESNRKGLLIGTFFI